MLPAQVSAMAAVDLGTASLTWDSESDGDALRFAATGALHLGPPVNVRTVDAVFLQGEPARPETRLSAPSVHPCSLLARLTWTDS